MMTNPGSTAPGPPSLGETLRKAPAFLGLQLGVQGLGFLGGLALVWSLPRKTFAMLALALAGQAFVQNLAEAGTGAALASLGGAQVSQPARFAEIVATVMSARRRIARWANLALAPVLGFFLLRLGLGKFEAVLALVVWAVGNSVQARADVLGRAAQISARPFATQRAELAGNLLRLAGWLGVGLAGTRLPNGPAVLAALAVQCVAFAVQVHLLGPAISPPAGADEHSGQIWRLFRAQFAANLLFSLQGFAGLAFLGVGPSPAQTADLAALARLGAPFTLLNSLLAALVVPVAARAPAETLRRTIGAIALGGAVAAVGLAACGALASGPLVLLLGATYHRLASEIPLFFGTLALSSVVGLLWALNCARGRVHGSWLYPAAMILAQGVFVAVHPVASVRDALLLTLVGFVPGLLVNGWMMGRTARHAD